MQNDKKEVGKYICNTNGKIDDNPTIKNDLHITSFIYLSTGKAIITFFTIHNLTNKAIIDIIRDTIKTLIGGHSMYFNKQYEMGIFNIISVPTTD